MAKAKWLFGLGGLVAGTVIGAGYKAILDELGWTTSREKAIPGQARVNRALDQLLAEARREAATLLKPEDRYIVFSDQHMGARNPADDFEPCEAAYIAALEHYDREGYKLVLLGDCEEFLEEPVVDVMASYDNIFNLLKRFYPDRLVKIYGNHDLAWQSKTLVEKHLHPYLPGIDVRGCLLLRYEGVYASGDIFLVHGHQGTLTGDVLASLGDAVLPWFRRLQMRTGLGRTLPSEDVCLRSQQDNRMYIWASRQRKLMLIAGHTHRPVWSSVTLLEKKVWQLHTLREMKPEDQPPDYQQLVDKLAREVDRMREESPPCFDVVKTRPAYFNTGCCCYNDGEITGMEIEGGFLRLIRWAPNDAGAIEREVLEERALSRIFFDL